MSKPLTFTLHIGGQQVDTLTDEQRAELARRFYEAIDRCYQLNPSAFWKNKNKEKFK